MANRRQMREQAIRLAIPGAAFVLASALIVALWPAELNDVLPSWVLAIVLAVALVLLLGAMLIGLLIGRRIVGDKVEIALRETDGRWRHGRAELQGSSMTFLPYFWQVRIPTGEQEALEVLNVDPRLERRPRFRELWALNFQARVIFIRTDRGTGEMAAMPSQLDRIAREIGTPGN